MSRPSRHEFKPWQRRVAAVVLPPAFLAAIVSLEACSSSSSSTNAAATATASSAAPNRSPSAANSPETGRNAFTQAQTKIRQFGNRCEHVHAVSIYKTTDSYRNPVTKRGYTFGGLDLTCQTTRAGTSSSTSAIEEVTVTEPNNTAYQVASTLDGNGNVISVNVTKIKNEADGQTQIFTTITDSGLSEVKIAGPGQQPESYAGAGSPSELVEEVYAALDKYLPQIETTALTSPTSFMGNLAISGVSDPQLLAAA
jgi:hypothetical protein